MKNITKENSYLAKQNITSIADYTECLQKLSTNFEEEMALKTATPIFLDTNVLLRYYSISFTAREKLLDFIKSNSSRIVLSTQVQLEFIKNREDVIQRFFEQVTNKIPKDFNSDVVNKMNVFLEQHKIVLKDYPFVETGIKKHQTELEDLLKKLNENADLKRKEYVNLIVKDDFLDIIKTCQLYDSLTHDEFEIIKKDFDLLSKNISNENLDAIYNKPHAVFPGLGDIKNKPLDPYGDYIIFHEIMKYMMNSKCDCIFLTFDNSKGDWMSKNKSQHFHYVQNMYANTGQILYILDAERTLGDLLNVDIESLVVSDIATSILSIKDIEGLSLKFKIFTEVSKSQVTQRIIDELILNGYQTIEDVQRDLRIAIPAIRKYRELIGPHLSNVGIIRIGLRIVNSLYNIKINPNGETENISDDDLKKYKSFQKYLL
ncbi:PIN-like domain-containing protein [Flavobacterium terrigena]|uniref:PIN like domain-containing protein n=1 Tax=Flavobacterium terrigena TaxID=402734 RepID=A0A1H6QK47_9FLAO|nr:PIN-like domain-containing protein [Flavobacterium terrigena]SEI44108.1 hypothetical protein SAMN05660918_0591 [Flavobacterium terrigena]